MAWPQFKYHFLFNSFPFKKSNSHLFLWLQPLIFPSPPSSYFYWLFIVFIITSIFPIISVNHFISDYLLNPWNLLHLFTTQLKMLSWISAVPSYSQGEKTWRISEPVVEIGPFHFLLWWDRMPVRSMHWSTPYLLIPVCGYIYWDSQVHNITFSWTAPFTSIPILKLTSKRKPLPIKSIHLQFLPYSKYFFSTVLQYTLF